MEKSYILLDVGGTQIKGGIADHTGTIKGELIIADAHSRECKEKVFDNLAWIIQELLKREKASYIAGIGMAFPGPFDYEKGISWMKGLNKYEHIYGTSVKEEIKARVSELRNAQFCFLHDIEAFAIGEYWFGKAQNSKKILCLCIGTGAGSAFLEDKVVLKEEKNGVPLDGWIFPTPYKESVIDDYLSVRGLEKLSQKILGKSCNGKELYELCGQNHRKALEVYQEFGKDLRKSIVPFLEGFQPNDVIFGGQISKSFAYFGQEFRLECKKRSITIHLEPEISMKAMQGLLAVMKQKEWRE